MSKLITRGVLVAAIVLGGLAVTGAASAAPGGADATDTRARARTPELAGFTYSGMYPGQSSCEEAGKEGINKNWWWRYECVKSKWSNYWDLYTQKGPYPGS